MRIVKPDSVDAYIAGFPKSIQTLLRKVRRTIRAAAPKADEVISYNIPAYKQHGMVVYFAGFKGHIGLFPPVRGNAALEKSVKPYAGPKGNLRFPYKEALPLALISRIVKHQVKQDRERAALRKKKRSR
jgi:uncharacterized protein YdhG (YjbR/CyaY superfamily)